jgi:hypothetical protein
MGGNEADRGAGAVAGQDCHPSLFRCNSGPLHATEKGDARRLLAERIAKARLSPMHEFTTRSPECQQEAAGSAPYRPEPPWPPAYAVRRVLAAARSRYHCLSPSRRPSLRDPRSYIGLFPASDLLALSCSSYWPLPREALAWLAEPPAARSLRRERRERGIAAVVREVLTADLPEAVAYLTRRNGR